MKKSRRSNCHDPGGPDTSDYSWWERAEGGDWVMKSDLERFPQVSIRKSYVRIWPVCDWWFFAAYSYITMKHDDFISKNMGYSSKNEGCGFP